MGGIISNNFKLTLKRNDFFLGSIIGIGGFGIIKEVRRIKDNKWFAIKEYNLNNIKTNKDFNIIINELIILKRILIFPFLISIYASFYDSHSNTISFILELLSGGDLRLLLNNYEIFNEYKVAYIISCIGSALHYLHCNNIIHRDIKPENIMFNSHGIPKLIDFGISTVFSNIFTIPYSQSSSGTKEYLAPEVFVPKTHYHSFESDFWSLGMVMYELLFHQRPYEGIMPISFVKYSHKTYQSTWEAITTTIVTNTVDIAHTSLNTNSSIVPISGIDKSSRRYNKVDNTSFESFVLNNNNNNTNHSIPLDSSLVIPIPDNIFINIPTSEDCKNLLSSLLDIRIHLRLGVGDKYLPFINHSWFLNFGINSETLSTLSSPITPDLDGIGDILLTKFYKLNFPDIDSKHNNNSVIPSSLSPPSSSKVQQQNQDSQQSTLLQQDQPLTKHDINLIISDIKVDYISPHYPTP